MGRLILYIRTLSIIFLQWGCGGLEETEEKKIRERNCKVDVVYRSSGDVFFPVGVPELSSRPEYPWERVWHLPQITKDFFRCKGSAANPPIVNREGGVEGRTWVDCEGGSRHGLPVIHGKEGVYPILIDLLNFVQRKTGKRVVITCGHRCPVHNVYVDPASKANRSSKHQMGAEVDFYVQGMEERPLEVVDLLMRYYAENEMYRGQKEYETFRRYEKGDVDVAIQPWMNKEIYIKMYQKNEGRDEDNRHSYSYIAVQVRYDRDKGERVVYDWAKANQGYLRG